MKIINSKNAPAALGPYVQAIEVNNTLYVSGCVPINPASNKVEATDITGQTLQVLKNLQAILDEAGYNKNEIVKCTVFLKTLDDFAACNKQYASFFGNHKPARACVAVCKIAADSLVEIDAIAVKEEKNCCCDC